MGVAWVHTALAQQIVFGDGAVAQLPDLVKAVGARRVLLITTPGRAESPEGVALARSLGRTLVSTFAEVEPHVPASVVQQALLQARRDAVDAVVSFGGGASADLGKAVCFFLEQEAGVPGASHVDRPVVAHVSVPTTYSGAELTPFFGMTDPGTGQKQGAGGPTSAPLVAIYDPALTLSMPARVSAETGMNALAHCVEAAWSPRRTPEAEAIALAGASAIARWLPLVVERPDDREARAGMFEGACLAGRSLHNAGMGVHHGLAQLLGGRTRVAHGLLNAVLLAHTVRFNEPVVPDAVARLGAAIGVPGDGARTGATAEAIDRLRASLGLPAGLHEVGVGEEDLDAVARLSQSSASIQGNPRPVSEQDARALLQAAW
jgi:maleylacetate reductase